MSAMNGEKNSVKYWNDRFQGDWSSNGGEKQSWYFYSILLNMLPTGIKEEIAAEQMPILDVGCATGTGTALIKNAFPNSSVVGIDFSETAIQTARSAYPQCGFDVADIYAVKKPYDVVVASNVLEHLGEPGKALSNLFAITKRMLVVMVPFCDEMLEPEHVNRFTLEDFPAVKGGFVVSWCKVVETDPQFWKGCQLLVVYRPSGQGLNLSQIVRNIPIQYLLLNAFTKMESSYLQEFSEESFRRLEDKEQFDFIKRNAEVFYWKLLHKMKAEECLKLEWEKAQIDNRNASAEAERVQAEKARALAEDAWKKAEKMQKEAEGKLALAEKAQTVAESRRLQVENALEIVESGRMQAEKSQAVAEADRSRAEKAQAEAEAGRSRAEKAQAEAEAGRARAEKAQAEAAAGRVRAEKAQAEAEAAREQAEKAQAEAEAGRARAEKVRAEAEAAREQAEKAQTEAETGRARAEKAQAEAEAKAAFLSAKIESAFAEIQVAKERKCSKIGKAALLFRHPEAVGDRGVLKALFEYVFKHRPLAPDVNLFTPVEEVLRSKPIVVVAGQEESDWVRWANSWNQVVIMTCAFEYNELVNQRPINAAKWFASHGYRVIYIAWQWSPDERLLKGCTLVSDGVYQVPLYEFFSRQAELMKRINDGKLWGMFLLSLPAECFMEATKSLIARGYSVQYDIMDDWEQFAKNGQAPWYKNDVERNFVQLSDHVYAVSEALAEKFHGIRSDISVVGNGYSEAVLRAENKFIALKRSETNSKDRVRVGYFGHLTDAWFDWDSVFSLAQTGNYTVDIIGYGMPDNIAVLVKKYDTINYIGTVEPSQLHKYTALWRCAILPFKESKLSLAVDPIKIYEYIYFGLRTVVLGMPHLKSYSNTYCVSPKDFVREVGRVCDIAFDKDGADKFLAETSWDARFAKIENEARRCSTWGSLYV